MKKRFTALMLMLAILIIPAAAAKTYRQQIAVEYGISLYINGKDAPLLDPNSHTVRPFVYNGTTYVPIRAVADHLGASVDYDAASNTALISNDAESRLHAIVFLHDISKYANVAHMYGGLITDYLLVNESISNLQNSRNILDSAITYLQKQLDGYYLKENPYNAELRIHYNSLVELNQLYKNAFDTANQLQITANQNNVTSTMNTIREMQKVALKINTDASSAITDLTFANLH